MASRRKKDTGLPAGISSGGANRVAQGREVPQSSSRGLVAVILALGCVSIAGFLAQKYSPPRTPSADEPPRGYPKLRDGYIITKPVPRVWWSPDKPIAEAMLARKTPAILENTLVTKWKARTSWNLDYLKQHTADQITGIYHHTIPRFGPLFRSKKQMGSIPTIKSHNPHTYVNISKEDFFRQISNPALDENGKPKEYLYYTGDLDTPSLVRDIDPFTEFILTPGRSTMNVWAGQAGVMAHTHLDSYDNFFVQLHGRKRFLLFEPEQARHLHPYPFLHPSYAQAQVDIDAPDFKAFPWQRDATCWEADLRPGDLLYIPPLWWHNVVAVDASVSVNIWSIGKEQDGFDKLISSTVKTVNHQWPQPVRRAAAHFIVTNALKLIAADCVARGNVSMERWETKAEPADAFVAYLLRERYENLFAKGELARTIPDVDLCTLSTESFTISERSKLNWLAKIVAQEFAPLSPGNRHWWMGNFVETLAFWGTSDASHAGPFLANCFSAAAPAASSSEPPKAQASEAAKAPAV